MQFLMRFLARFRVQNAPYPTLHECCFREASRRLERELSHIISRHPSFQFLLTWRYFVAELRDYEPVRGRLWQVLYAKSHQNRMKNRMCKRAFRKHAATSNRDVCVIIGRGGLGRVKLMSGIPFLTFANWAPSLAHFASSSDNISLTRSVSQANRGTFRCDLTSRRVF